MFDFGPHIGPNGLLVYWALSRFASADKRECWPSVPMIAKTAQVSTRTVQRTLRTLADAGLIRITHRIAEKGCPASSIYTLLDIAEAQAILAAQSGVTQTGGATQSPGGGVTGTPGWCQPDTRGGATQSPGWCHTDTLTIPSELNPSELDPLNETQPTRAHAPAHTHTRETPAPQAGGEGSDIPVEAQVKTRSNQSGLTDRELEAEFDAEFWPLYPKGRSVRSRTLPRYKAVRKNGAALADILAGLERWIESAQWVKGGIVGHPSSLRQKAARDATSGLQRLLYPIFSTCRAGARKLDTPKNMGVIVFPTSQSHVGPNWAIPATWRR
jgi:hypothetical protein